MSQYWLGGVHAVEEALKQGRVERLEIADHKRSKNVLALADAARDAGVPVDTVPGYAIDMHLPGVRHQGVAALCTSHQHAANWQDAIAGKEKPFILILDHLEDPHNLGACLRSAQAAGVDAVLMPNSRAADLTPAARKVASGAAEQLPIFRVPNLKREVENMKKQGIWIVGGAGEGAQTLYDLDLNLPLALIVGNEGDGIRHGLKEACDHLARIPMPGDMESLNVSVACGILLFETVRQRLKT
ncbi:MAG: 23S rRNA (guanosine(2251)-2'-O)-methyltransferase RlmB [Cardiobacteriaceae bacterium]|nr:23S rRNA (guanosine(2251)-2'-O)-methyltransferase RlmB [Cardiobacteriaceae bacterium]